MNNGNDSGRNQSFTYDPLDRILAAQTAAMPGQDCWGFQFGTTWNLADDALGNLLAMSVTKCTGPSLSVSVNANNQITNPGFSYDAAGNMTADGAYSYAYSAENQVTSAGGVNYTYDGDGLRVQKSNGALYWRSYSGQVIEETDASGNLQRDYVFFGGRRIAWADSNGNVYNQFADALGSTRLVTDSSGNTCFDADYYPYGQENDYAASCSPAYKFTGYEFDAETGDYYVYARFYDPRIGRFLSADPHDGAPANPQSLNRYAYVVNNPTNLVDPSREWGMSPPPPPPPAQDWYCLPGNDWIPEGGYSFPNCGPIGPNGSGGPSLTCPLEAPQGCRYTVGLNLVALFAPAMANALSAAFKRLNREGIVPEITDGFRTAAQQQARQGSPYGAAQVSWHQVGMAVDLNSKVAKFPFIVSAMTSAGLTWGGVFSQPDPVHFQLAARGTSPSAAQVAACEQEHP